LALGSLLALTIAATFAETVAALAPKGKNFLAILVIVSPATTVYFLTVGLGVAGWVGVGLGDGVGLGETLGFGVAVGFGVALGEADGVGVADGELVGVLGESGTGRFIGAEADFLLVPQLAKAPQKHR